MKFILILILFILILLLITNKENFMNENVYTNAFRVGKDYIDLKLMENILQPAVMFDIDDTLLYIPPNNKPTSIDPIIKLLTYCKCKGILVIIITARDIKYKNQTISQLDFFNIPYDRLYLRDPKQDDFHFKTIIKENLTKCGMTFLMSVGDNNIDVEGPASGLKIRLPNKNEVDLKEYLI